jgi:hypothetical protein
MDREVQDVIQFQLDHLSHNEQNEAFNYLILVGLKHYKLLYAEGIVDIPTLQALCGKYTKDLRGRRSKHKPLPFAVRVGHERQIRLDTIQHYPFADNVGSMPQVLYAPSDVPKLLEMGAPARKRLVEKVFQEMRCNQAGIRMSDIPEALDVSMQYA